MKVILLDDLRHSGRSGDVVEVKAGFARNYLLPQGLAALATTANLRWFEQQRTKIDARHTAEKSEIVEFAARIEGTTVVIAKRAGESDTLYGAVTPAEVVTALEEKGIEVDRRTIDLGGGIKSTGDHQVRIDLHPEVVAEITVQVVSEG